MFSRYNHIDILEILDIDILASGYDVFPCPDTKGVATGVELGGVITTEPCFLAMLKACFLLTDFFNLVLYTHPIFLHTDFQYKHFERSQSTGNTSRKHFSNFPTGPGHPSVV